MVDDVLKELRKTGEKLMIRVSAAGSACQESAKNNKEIEDSTEEEIESLKKSIQGTAESLGSSIKGQFGKKAQESLEKHSESFKGV
ncbi:hypothetical protein [Enterococcus sp. BWR-S5]|uniref:hypothetical protein n=1 Tax=Enterococcus sp. BWR-S5 TaxID=2787714 RepID=UPI0019245CE1|nr:hypothetical protein [Enterococcus sp. BWR-S5]MBL1224015.1 hypothetical protein [Enterococcus sp. BWR-S5]